MICPTYRCSCSLIIRLCNRFLTYFRKLKDLNNFTNKKCSEKLFGLKLLLSPTSLSLILFWFSFLSLSLSLHQKQNTSLERRREFLVNSILAERRELFYQFFSSFFFLNFETVNSMTGNRPDSVEKRSTRSTFKGI